MVALQIVKHKFLFASFEEVNVLTLDIHVALAMDKQFFHLKLHL